jgi:transposase
MFERRGKRPTQGELFVMSGELPEATPDAFYRRVDRTLESVDFARQVWEICEPAYADTSRGGRPGIDPVVYLKMLMVGFFEDLPSERAIASRCGDSLSIRGFLGYGLTEATPDHSSLSVIRDRLSLEQLRALHVVLLAALHEHGLLKGRKLGIDSSIIEANASLRALQHRNNEQSYWDYVKNLAREAGIDPEDTKGVRRFDKKRKGRKTSNAEWVNPHDPEAKVGRTKDGATDMVYKPEHVSDLESGAIVRVEVRSGDAGDTEAMSERIMDAVQLVAEALPEEKHDQIAQSVCSDEGYFAVTEVAALQAAQCRVVIGDPQANRRRQNASEEEKRTLRKARCAVESGSGKALLRRRGEYIERSFCHVLDHGGLRRATLRGCEKLTKRHYVAAMTYNLSLLLRHLFGIGTPKQWMAAVRGVIFAVLFTPLRHWRSVRRHFADIFRRLRIRAPGTSSSPRPAITAPNGAFSTGC